ncbi:hypothetical protein Poly24_51460 [Rosistilla carotiformis]|uniref:Uncharacterized protein n=1 Tax=Rosistilla carotiformis TaxID=2528017 RepID=A0A518K0U4_9BACT|nr:hypothetical protein Poly24_51460 [Rosistilla carotiformis]
MSGQRHDATESKLGFKLASKNGSAIEPTKYTVLCTRCKEKSKAL